jgi:hypothetical protein
MTVRRKIIKTNTMTVVVRSKTKTISTMTVRRKIIKTSTMTVVVRSKTKTISTMTVRRKTIKTSTMIVVVRSNIIKTSTMIAVVRSKIRKTIIMTVVVRNKITQTTKRKIAMIRGTKTTRIITTLGKGKKIIIMNANNAGISIVYLNVDVGNFDRGRFLFNRNLFSIFS